MPAVQECIAGRQSCAVVDDADVRLLLQLPRTACRWFAPQARGRLRTVHMLACKSVECISQHTRRTGDCAPESGRGHTRRWGGAQM